MKRSSKFGSYVMAGSMIALNVESCYILPQERCLSSGFFEGIVEGGGDPIEVYGAVLVDHLCSFAIQGIEEILSGSDSRNDLE